MRRVERLGSFVQRECRAACGGAACRVSSCVGCRAECPASCALMERPALCRGSVVRLVERRVERRAERCVDRRAERLAELRASCFVRMLCVLCT